jgi:hypothetical protein
MDHDKIVEDIDAMIRSLEQARALLTGHEAPLKPGLPPSERSGLATKRRKVSAAGRARMAAAQKARWAKAKN